MAGRESDQLLDLVCLHQLRSQHVLVLCYVRHVEDLTARTDVLLRRAMAIEAPLHRQRRGLESERHLVDAAVAARAADAFAHVNAVVEVYEVRQPMDAAPDDRCVRGEAGAHRLEHRSIYPD